MLHKIVYIRELFWYPKNERAYRLQENLQMLPHVTFKLKQTHKVWGLENRFIEIFLNSIQEENSRIISSRIMILISNKTEKKNN